MSRADKPFNSRVENDAIRAMGYRSVLREPDDRHVVGGKPVLRKPSIKPFLREAAQIADELLIIAQVRRGAR